jgi:hypothetical protein
MEWLSIQVILYIIEDSQHETIEMKDGVAFNTGNTF